MVAETVGSASIATAIATKGFATLFSELIKAAFRPSGNTASVDLPESKFEKHFMETFARCTKVKTLISRDEPVDLLQTYVNIKLAKAQSGIDVDIDDYDLIEEARKKRHVTIVGTAGGGKTVFMKYLWVSYFVRPEGKVPIFLELRRLNELTSVDIHSFIFHNIVAIDSRGGMENYKSAVGSGKFIFIFDGFDEVAEDRRASIEKQIVDIVHGSPDNIVIVSGRPDDRFHSWQKFTSYKVKPFTQEQVVSLIEKVDFDPIVKTKFLKEIKSELYHKHSSFLASPLLSLMMLMTFQHYAEIPEKIHVFYDMAFDTLFSRHDALKEVFNRKKYTNYPIDVFKRKLGFFCLITYMEHKFEFTKDELLQYIRKSAEIDSGEIDAEAFYRDMVESVCLLQRDGMLYNFTHRSFQEFFTSYCLLRVPPSKLKAILIKIAARRSDNVLMMLKDMNRNIIEEFFVIPMIRNTKRHLRKIGVINSGLDVIKAYGLSLYVHVLPKQQIFTSSRPQKESSVERFWEISTILYPEYFTSLSVKMDEFRAMDQRASKRFPPSASVYKSRGILLLVGESSESLNGNPKKTVPPNVVVDLCDWFLDTGYAGWLLERQKSFVSMLNEIPRNNRKRDIDIVNLLKL